MTAVLTAEMKTFIIVKETRAPGVHSLILFLMICVSPRCRLLLAGLSDSLNFTLIPCNYSAVCL